MTVAIAVPLLLAAAAVEVWVSPQPDRSGSAARTQTGRPEGRPVALPAKRLGRYQHLLCFVAVNVCGGWLDVASVVKVARVVRLLPLHPTLL